MFLFWGRYHHFKQVLHHLELPSYRDNMQIISLIHNHHNAHFNQQIAPLRPWKLSTYKSQNILSSAPPSPMPSLCHENINCKVIGKKPIVHPWHLLPSRASLLEPNPLGTLPKIFCSLEEIHHKSFGQVNICFIHHLLGS